MRARYATLAALALAGAGCTAFVAANLSGTSGTVQHFVGGCFQMADTTCGQCIANNCEDPSNSTQPVSLEQVCKLAGEYSTVKSAAQSCAENSSISNYSCDDLFVDGGTYATSIGDQQAAENNVKQCITQKCATSCSRCAVEVPTCGSDTIDLLEAGTCGACIDNAMNVPGAPCQQFVLQHSCSEYSSGSLAQCAIPAGSCQSPDCTDISGTDAGVSACVWNQCGPNGTNQCPSQ